MKRFSIYGMMMVCALALTFVSCGDDDKRDDAPTTFAVTPDNVTMYAGQTKQLSAVGATQWSSDNEFVASVDKKGLIQANHVGTANILASDGNAMGQCAVTVQPQYNCWATPLLTWGASMSEIAEAETHQLETTAERYLVYSYPEGSTSAMVQYLFDNRGLEGINVVADASEYNTVASFLSERYLFYKQDDEGVNYFINATTLETSTMVVALSNLINRGTNFTVVTYICHVSRSSGPIEAPRRALSSLLSTTLH